CFDLARQLLHSRDLEELLSDDWLMTGVIQTADDAAPLLREAVHVVIQNHRRWLLMRNSAAGYFMRLGEPTETQEEREFGWLGCLNLVHRLNDESYSVCRRIDETLDGTLRHHLRRYRCANLLYSWI